MSIKKIAVAAVLSACCLNISTALAVNVTGAICNHTKSPATLSAKATFAPSSQVIVVKDQTIAANRCQHLFATQPSTLMTIDAITFTNSAGKVVNCKGYPQKFTTHTLIFFTGSDCRKKRGY